MEKNLHIANGKDSTSFIAYLNYSVCVRYLRCLRAPTYAISMLEDACVCNFDARERRLVYIKFLRVGERHLLRCACYMGVHVRYHI